MTHTNGKIALALAAVVCIAGCSSMREVRTEAEQAHQSATNAAQSLMDRRVASVGQPVRGPVVTDIPFVNVKPIPKAPSLPVTFNRVVTFAEPVGLPMDALAQRLSEVIGMRVTYQHDLVRAGGEDQTAGAQAAPAFPNLPSLPGSASATTRPGRDMSVAVNYPSGSVTGLLDAVATSAKASWEYDDQSNTVHFYKFKTELFRIAMVQGAAKSSTQMGGKSSSSSSGGSGGETLETAQAEATFATSASLWDGIEDGVKKLLSPEGVFSISEVGGTILVRDVPQRMQLVEKFINDTNAALSRQVDVAVTVYRVMARKSDIRSVNWDLLFQSLIDTSAYDVQWLTPRADTASDGLASLIIGTKETDQNGVPHRYGGTQAFLDSLSRFGDTSVVTNTSVVTVNNHPAPVKVVRRHTYLAEVTPTFVGTSGSAVAGGAALTPGTVETGLNLFLLPHVQDDGKRLLLNVMVSLSTLEQMDTYTSAGSSIQQPQVASREFQQMAWLNSGETLVLAGFEQVDAGLDSSGQVDRKVWWLGGRRDATKEKEMVVVAIRPVVTAARSRI